MPRNSKQHNKAEKAVRTATGAVTGTLGLVFKIIITLLLVILTTCLLFVCIFAFYVKTSLVDDLDISLDDYSLS